MSLTLVISYFVDCSYMYTLREKYSAYHVFSLFLLLYSGNCCGYVNRIYDSEGGTCSAHCSQSHSLDLNFDVIWYMFAAALGMAYFIVVYVKKHISVISASDKENLYKSSLKK